MHDVRHDRILEPKNIMCVVSVPLCGSFPMCTNGETPLMEANDAYPCEKGCPKGFFCEMQDSLHTPLMGICCANRTELNLLYGPDNSAHEDPIWDSSELLESSTHRKTSSVIPTEELITSTISIDSSVSTVKAIDMFSIFSNRTFVVTNEEENETSLILKQADHSSIIEPVVTTISDEHFQNQLLKTNSSLTEQVLNALDVFDSKNNQEILEVRAIVEERTVQPEHNHTNARINTNEENDMLSLNEAFSTNEVPTIISSPVNVSLSNTVVESKRAKALIKSSSAVEDQADIISHTFSPVEMTEKHEQRILLTENALVKAGENDEENEEHAKIVNLISESTKEELKTQYDENETIISVNVANEGNLRQSRPIKHNGPLSNETQTYINELEATDVDNITSSDDNQQQIVYSCERQKYEYFCHSGQVITQPAIRWYLNENKQCEYYPWGYCPGMDSLNLIQLEELFNLETPSRRSCSGVDDDKNKSRMRKGLEVVDIAAKFEDVETELTERSFNCTEENCQPDREHESIEKTFDNEAREKSITTLAPKNLISNNKSIYVVQSLNDLKQKTINDISNRTIVIAIGEETFKPQSDRGSSASAPLSSEEILTYDYELKIGIPEKDAVSTDGSIAGYTIPLGSPVLSNTTESSYSIKDLTDQEAALETASKKVENHLNTEGQFYREDVSGKKVFVEASVRNNEIGKANRTEHVICYRSTYRFLCENGMPSQFVYRWAKEDGRCRSFPYGYCLSELNYAHPRTLEECEQYCD
ncbi:Kunitz/Bovine pancreatic trypsin inhibitor domain protein [Dictyocaulus viviparus]|uniref:Kunitz/Bovine pancreatic trypsin inhibitor domain protein n=1 Tax=Dictyocaulus viviparus TaxID=29172 RepID=A0A0D8XH11_DICVI|nr:Kunitz/Bovine pancreatic trypsin inhibitor domain protein [Dictyocaulus viviparus]